MIQKKLIILCLIILFYNVFLSCSKSKTISINNVRLKVEIADTSKLRSKGLMFRKSLDEDKGMLFIFNKVKVVSFWMKNTFIPLSVAFINEDFKIIHIEDMSPLDEETIHTSLVSIKYAIEVNQGWFKKNDIKIGDKIKGIK